MDKLIIFTSKEKLQNLLNPLPNLPQINFVGIDLLATHKAMAIRGTTLYHKVKYTTDSLFLIHHSISIEDFKSFYKQLQPEKYQIYLLYHLNGDEFQEKLFLQELSNNTICKKGKHTGFDNSYLSLKHYLKKPSMGTEGLIHLIWKENNTDLIVNFLSNCLKNNPNFQQWESFLSQKMEEKEGFKSAWEAFVQAPDTNAKNAAFIQMRNTLLS